MKITTEQLKKIIIEELEAMNAVSQDVLAKKVAKAVMPKLKDVDLPPELQMFAGKSPEEITAMLQSKMQEGREEDAYFASQGGGAGGGYTTSSDDRGQTAHRTLDRGGESKPVSVVADGVELITKALVNAGLVAGSGAVGYGLGKLITLGVTAALASGPVAPATLLGAVLAGIFGYAYRDYQQFSKDQGWDHDTDENERIRLRQKARRANKIS